MAVPTLPAMRGYNLVWDPNTLMWVAKEQTAPGGAAAWGSITGTLSAQTDLQTALDAKAPTASPTFTGTVSGVTKAHVGLGNVDNTSDANKPVSTAQQTALDAKEATANKNAASGYAGLDASSKLTGSQQVYGTLANTACQGNDARLSDSRTPTAHSTSHKSGGGDAIKLDELAAPTDVTTLNASTTAHGLMQKYPGGTTTFLRADGSFAAPTAAAADPVYSPGSFTVATETGRFMPSRLKLATSERATIEGTGRLLILG